MLSNVKLKDAALIEPLAVGRHALTISDVELSNLNSDLVTGRGPLGIDVLLYFRAAGARAVFLIKAYP